jgi:hypothetical protein
MSLIEAGPKETIKRDYGQALVSWSERALASDLQPRRASSVDLNYFHPGAPCLGVIITTRSLRAQEMAALEAVEVAVVNVLVVLDFQAERAVRRS